jgi:uncharacterized protein (TIGR03000 family)
MYTVVLMMALTSSGETPDCHRRHSCHGGGYGACYGGGYGGCYGGGYGGCYGGGYGGCYGGGYGGVYYGGCYGGMYYGGGSGGWFGGGERRPGEPLKMPSDKKPEDKKPDEVGKPIGSAGARARIIVSMPADSRFTIDDYTSPARSETHVIVSGPLADDQTRTYALKAEVFRDGRWQAMEERVTVRGGEEKRVTLTLPTGVVAR